MAPVASVAARKVSAKSFFMDCSFHCSTIRRNFSEPHHFIFGPSPSSRAARFFIDGEHRNGNREREFFREQLEPLFPGFVSFYR
jgi:hypothetical protein